MSGADGSADRSASSSTSSLDQLVELAQRATPSEVTALILRAIEHPNIYAFGELLDVPSVEAQKDTAAYRLLELFAFGTYAEYRTNAQLHVQELNETQLRKLKALTVIQLAQTNKQLSYDQLLAALDLDNVRQLEDLVIELIYRDLLRAKLDQSRQTIDIEYTVGRDVRREQLGELIHTLDMFRANYETVMRTLEAQMSAANDEKRCAAVAKERLDAELTAVQKTLKTVAAGSPSHRVASCTTGATHAHCDLLDDVAAADSSLAGVSAALQQSSAAASSRHPKKTKKATGAPMQTSQFGIASAQMASAQLRGGAALQQSTMLQNLLSAGAGLFGGQAPLDVTACTGSSSSASSSTQRK